MIDSDARTKLAELTLNELASRCQFSLKLEQQHHPLVEKKLVKNCKSAFNRKFGRC